jgi:S-adenosylmethionine synthetase
VKKYYESWPQIYNLFDNDNITYNVNPTGRWVDGSPAQDAGSVGRKLIVDSYGSACPIGGGAQSGKTGDKQDRSGMYITRYIAKNLVAAGVADRVVIQVSYGIGLVEPLSVYVNTYGTNHTPYDDGEIADKIADLFDLTPYGIIQHLKLKNPIYAETAAYGQVGQEPRIVHKRFDNKYGDVKEMDVELFTWEKLDAVEDIQNAFFNNTAN